MSASEPALKELLERVRKLGDPSGELDADICLAVFPGASKSATHPLAFNTGKRDRYDRRIFRETLALTSSLDACLALMKEKLPGDNVEMSVGGRDLSWSATLDTGLPVLFVNQSDRDDGNYKAPALALLDCILQALLHKIKEEKTENV